MTESGAVWTFRWIPSLVGRPRPSHTWFFCDFPSHFVQVLSRSGPISGPSGPSSGWASDRSIGSCIEYGLKAPPVDLLDSNSQSAGSVAQCTPCLFPPKMGFWWAGMLRRDRHLRCFLLLYPEKCTRFRSTFHDIPPFIWGFEAVWQSLCYYMLYQSILHLIDARKNRAKVGQWDWKGWDMTLLHNQYCVHTSNKLRASWRTYREQRLHSSTRQEDSEYHLIFVRARP